MNLQRRHPADEMIEDEYSVLPSMMDDQQIEVRDKAHEGRIALDFVGHWTDEDCGILADMNDEHYAECFVGDRVAAQSFAQCAHISAGKGNHQLKHHLLAFRGADSPKAAAHMERMRRAKNGLVKISKAVALAMAASVMLTGCVTYVHKFDPHEQSLLCAHVMSKCAVMK